MLPHRREAIQFCAGLVFLRCGETSAPVFERKIISARLVLHKRTPYLEIAFVCVRVVALSLSGYC